MFFAVTAMFLCARELYKLTMLPPNEPDLLLPKFDSRDRVSHNQLAKWTRNG